MPRITLGGVVAFQSQPSLPEQGKQAGQFVSFTQYARLLMARGLLAPSGAVHIVAE